MKSLILFSFFIAITFCSQEIPIFSRYDGVKLGNLSSTFQLEAHYDLLCPGSQEAFFTLSKVISDYSLLQQNFLFIIHIFPLPYHTFSFKLSILEKFFQDNFGDLQALNYINYIFENQDSFSNANLSNLTNSQIDELIANKMTSTFSVTESQILDALNNGTYNQEARLSWKLGCHRSVAGTPTHIVNGIKVNDSWEMGYEEWVAFLKNYFNLEKKEEVVSIRNPN